MHTRQTQPTLYPLPMDLPDTDGYVAVRDCELIGTIIWLRPANYHSWESFLVADCARQDNSDGTRTWMDTRWIIGEVDYLTAVRWNTVGQMVKVWPRNTYTARMFRIPR